MSVKLYVEGGGDRTELKARCREGFRKLMEKAGFVGRMPRIVACGSTPLRGQDAEKGGRSDDLDTVICTDVQQVPVFTYEPPGDKVDSA